MKTKIKKFAGIADENLSTEQIMSLTRDYLVILVDSNVLINIFTQDAKWYSWALNAFSDAAFKERIAINPIIYSEI